jgi:N-acetylglucosaminyldiphosphoundecaprenol N-acetyl-beta-D-mannosaminyltransferase
MRNPVAILGVPIDDLTTQQVLGRIEEFVHSRRFHQIATANTDFLIQSLEDPELKAILWTSDMVVPDGMPLARFSAKRARHGSRFGANARHTLCGERV